MQNHDDLNQRVPKKAKSLIRFAPVWAEGKHWHPNFGNYLTLTLLKRNLPKKVSFKRAYAGWRSSGAKEEKELGEGRAFLRWLQKHHLAIDWCEKDFELDPLFHHPEAPKHDPQDEMAQGLSFAIRPVVVDNRKVKLYIKDEDILGLWSLSYGEEVDFLELVSHYIKKRFLWHSWNAPAPSFIDWVRSDGKRPIFGPGQIGFLISYLKTE